jgi:O-antigen ligase
MIRLTILYLFVGTVMIVSVRRWYVGLCGLVFLTVLTQHPSMPTKMIGVPGLNPWNATLLVVTICWLINRRFDPPRVPTSRTTWLLISLYTLLVITSGLAATYQSATSKTVLSARFAPFEVIVETIINPLKYLMVGVLFFDGARTRKRARMALYCAIGSGLLYSLLMFKSMKLGVFTIDYQAARRLTDKLVGLFANDLAELFAFTLWAGIIAAFVMNKGWRRLAWIGLILSIVPTFVSLKSRAGFLAFAMTGVILATMRWRKIFLLLPLGAACVVMIAPKVVDRVLTGVGGRSENAESGNDLDEISAGRVTNLWPPVIDQIAKSPWFGHGRFAILSTPAADEIRSREGSLPHHPHNSYLEILIDAGIFGLLIGLTCAGALLIVSGSLMRLRGDPLITALGAAGFAAMTCELTAGIAGSSFFPTQSSVPYLCVWGVALRVHAERVQYSRSYSKATRRQVYQPALRAVRVEG